MFIYENSSLQIKYHLIKRWSLTIYKRDSRQTVQLWLAPRQLKNIWEKVSRVPTFKTSWIRCSHIQILYRTKINFLISIILKARSLWWLQLIGSSGILRRSYTLSKILTTWLIVFTHRRPQSLPRTDMEPAFRRRTPSSLGQVDTHTASPSSISAPQPARTTRPTWTWVCPRSHNRQTSVDCTCSQSPEISRSISSV